MEKWEKYATPKQPREQEIKSRMEYYLQKNWGHIRKEVPWTNRKLSKKELRVHEPHSGNRLRIMLRTLPHVIN